MKYDAFISYRHAKADMYAAKKLHRKLETFHVPRAIAKKSGKKNIKRVFRDQEELPAGSDLGDNIEKALAESEFLLVICTQRTPESYWVNKEIETFIKMHDREHVLAVLAEGEPGVSFPKPLLEDKNGSPVEPLAADIRGKTKAEINKKIKTEIIRLAAPLLHCGYDDLRQRHRERRIKKYMSVSAAVAVLALAFGAYSTYNTKLIQKNLKEKQINQSKYLADTALSLLEDGDRRTSALVALEALPSDENERPYVADAQYTLSRALYCYDTGNTIGMDRNLCHDLPVKSFHFNGDGTKIISVDQGETVYVWDSESGKKLLQVPSEMDEKGYPIEPVNATVYGEQVLIADSRGIHAVSFDGKTIWKTGEEGDFFDCVFDENLKLAACISSEQIVFFDMASGRVCDTMQNRMKASFGGEYIFSADKGCFAVSHLPSDKKAKKGCVSVFNFKTGKSTDISTASERISALAFIDEKTLAVAGIKDETGVETINSREGCVQKLDIATNKSFWKKKFTCQAAGPGASAVQLKCRSYKDETGRVHRETIMSVDNGVYTWDSNTGEQLARINTGNGILKLLVSTGYSAGYLAEGNGMIETVNLTNGTIYSGAEIDTKKALKDVEIKNGVLVIRSYESPFLTVMKYHEGKGIKKLDSYDDYVNSICYSADESYYAVDTYDDGTGRQIYFYKGADDSPAGEWQKPKDQRVENAGFINDKEYMAVTADKNFLFYNVSSRTTEEFSAGDEFSYGSCVVNQTASYALLYQESNYAVADLKKKKIIKKGRLEDYIYGGIISENGEWMYCSLGEKGVAAVEVKTGKASFISGDDYYVSCRGNVQDAFAINRDGNLLAISCLDNVLRIYDTVKKETAAEIPFMGNQRRFIRFSDDDTKIMLQGDDYYFRVYDLEKKEFFHISAEQYYQINSFSEDEKTISLVTADNMVILNKEDYERIAQVDRGKAYLPKNRKVFAGGGKTLYAFLYMTYEMLAKEAKEQFPGEKLTKPERLQYHTE